MGYGVKVIKSGDNRKTIVNKKQVKEYVYIEFFCKNKTIPEIKKSIDLSEESIKKVINSILKDKKIVKSTERTDVPKFSTISRDVSDLDEMDYYFTPFEWNRRYNYNDVKKEFY